MKINWIKKQPMVSSLVIEKNQKGIDFFCPSHGTRIVESGNARFIENGKIRGSLEPRKVEFQEVRVKVHSSITSQVVDLMLLTLLTIDKIND